MSFASQVGKKLMPCDDEFQLQPLRVSEFILLSCIFMCNSSVLKMLLSFLNIF